MDSIQSGLIDYLEERLDESENSASMKNAEEINEFFEEMEEELVE